MRNAKINKRMFYGLNYKGKTQVRDEHNNLTGETINTYGRAYKIFANISGARGSSQSEIFGTDIAYDKTFVLTSSEFEKLGIDENTIFFVDKKPEYSGSSPLYDYRVERIADTINSVVIAITKVGK